MYEYDRPRSPLRQPERDYDEGIEKYGTYYRKKDTMVGFTGHMTSTPEDSHVLECPLKKMMIRGYTGDRPKLKDLVGEPFIPSEEKQMRLFGMADSIFEETGMEEGTNYNFRMAAKHLDVMERYTHSVEQV